MPERALDQTVRCTRIRLDPEVASAVDTSARLLASPGTRRVVLKEGSESGREKAIFLPREDWSEVPAAALLEPPSGPATAAGHGIRVFRVPEYFHQFFWDLDLESILADRSEADAGDPLLAAFCREAARVLAVVWQPAGHGDHRMMLQVRAGGLSSTTYDAEFGDYVGLHVDDFEGLPIDRRAQSQSRIVVNMGRQPRSLVFIDLPLIEIFARCGFPASREDYDRFRWADPLAHVFMETFPDYPVTRLVLFPGEGYLAPTQDLIHDGYTVGMTEPDVLLHLKPPARPGLARARVQV